MRGHTQMRTGMCRCDMTREARGRRRGPFQWERALGVSITCGTAAFPAARVLRAAADTLCPELGGAQCSLATPAGTGGKCTVPWHERLHLLLSSQPEASQQRGSAAGECYQHSLHLWAGTDAAPCSLLPFFPFHFTEQSTNTAVSSRAFWMAKQRQA